MLLTFMGVGFYWFVNWPLHMEGKERLKKEADHCRLVGGSFNTQRELNLGDLSWVTTS